MTLFDSCNQIDNKKINSNTLDRFRYDNSQKLISYLNDFIEKDTTITNNNETLNDNSVRLKKELNILYQNKAKIGIFSYINYYYWSSTKARVLNYILVQNFSDSEPIMHNMGSTNFVRAVRSL